MPQERRYPALPPQPRYQNLASDLLAACREVYGQRLVALALYGSVARGTARPDSDLDFLLVARDLPQGRRQRMREFARVEKLLTPALEALEEAGVACALSPVLKSPAEVEAGSLLFLDLVTDAVLLYDREGFLAGVLQRLARRLEELGARKIVRGNAWFWDLKPDFKPGEEIKLW